jgi:hypothetical protein
MSTFLSIVTFIPSILTQFGDDAPLVAALLLMVAYSLVAIAAFFIRWR